MSPDVISEANIAIDTDPDADLSGADFGDSIEAPPAPAPKEKEPAAPVAPAAKDAPKRDEHGRFVKDGQPESQTPGEGEDDGEPVDPPEGAPEAPEDEGEHEDGVDGKPKMVPLKRFQEVIAQRNDLANRLNETQQQHSTAQTQARDEIKEILDARDKLYEEVETLRADGDTKGAAKLQRQIDDATQRVSDIKAGMVARQAAFAANENTSYDRMLDQIESAFTVMNPNSPDFDRTVVEEMEFQVQAYEKMGVPPTQALRRAVALIFREDPFTPRPATKEAPAGKPAASVPAPKKTNIAKNVDAANRTPPEVDHKTDLGDGQGSKSIYDMSDEELAALPPSVIARMRGDALQ